MCCGVVSGLADSVKAGGGHSITSSPTGYRLTTIKGRTYGITETAGVVAEEANVVFLCNPEQRKEVSHSRIS